MQPHTTLQQHRPQVKLGPLLPNGLATTSYWLTQQSTSERDAATIKPYASPLDDEDNSVRATIMLQVVVISGVGYGELVWDRSPIETAPRKPLKPAVAEQAAHIELVFFFFCSGGGRSSSSGCSGGPMSSLSTRELARQSVPSSSSLGVAMAGPLVPGSLGLVQGPPVPVPPHSSPRQLHSKRASSGSPRSPVRGVFRTATSDDDYVCGR